MKTKQEFDTVKVIIERLLREDVRTRNDDKYLTFRVMSHFTRIFIPFEDFKKMPQFESVSRIRRMIQSKRKDLRPTESIKLIRLQREEDIKEIVR